MVTSTSVDSPAECSPHHWLITEEPGASQHWTCVRCSVARTVDLNAPDQTTDQPLRWGGGRR